ncbi:hypothetical protein FN846DRAFT_896537 [Sphaerosporella brunnea]|uniref:Uncharacterized protein n=1 Tax=Sphaerosporella brunnea TaxID=1250544 RepID=A0A5J5EDL5_9PEZI|nr:hypothetical protein FN846DRAFT_896537 [Sphaerosporella brunnea]
MGYSSIIGAGVGACASVRLAMITFSLTGWDTDLTTTSAAERVVPVPPACLNLPLPSTHPHTRTIRSTADSTPPCPPTALSAASCANPAPRSAKSTGQRASMASIAHSGPDISNPIQSAAVNT